MTVVGGLPKTGNNIVPGSVTDARTTKWGGSNQHCNVSGHPPNRVNLHPADGSLSGTTGNWAERSCSFAVASTNQYGSSLVATFNIWIPSH